MYQGKPHSSLFLYTKELERLGAGAWLKCHFPVSVSSEQPHIQRRDKVLFAHCPMGEMAVRGETFPLIYFIVMSIRHLYLHRILAENGKTLCHGLLLVVFTPVMLGVNVQ